MLVYGWAADQGGIVAPKRELSNETSPPAASTRPGGCSGSTTGTLSASTPARASCSVLSSPGRLSHPSCASRLYAMLRGMTRQLSIEPVGHGEMHAMHCLHLSTSTT